MKKVLILGATGMAGHVVYLYLSELSKYIISTACFRIKIDETSFLIDVRDESALRRIISLVQPDYIVNCVGILINGSRSSSENCIYINAFFPHLLTRVFREINANGKLIHISTDCVFSGKKGMYSDFDLKDALDIYGMTKNLGEIINDHDITIRTSIIGPELKENGEGLFHWLFMQRSSNIINGYIKSIWGGVTTLELAKVIDRCIEADSYGLLQVSNGKGISKHDLLNLIIVEFNLSFNLKGIPGPEIDKSILPSSCAQEKLMIPDYPIMIHELKKFMDKHYDIYNYYLR